MGILQITYKQIEDVIPQNILDEVTGENGIGKKEGHYWVIKNNPEILQNPEFQHPDLHPLHQLLFKALREGYMSVMIIDENKRPSI